jgi:flavin-dependent dehydrogenase
MHPAPTSTGPELLAHWVAVLQRHGYLSGKFTLDPTTAWTVQLPLAGALAHEGVANRTLLVGPAGGFYSACGEDVYPGCWSAVFAADVLRKALKRDHLQDALGDYRQVWRTTLGDYLRGPQQNLRLLLPLVYRNPVMTARLAEAVLLSKSVVR